MGAHDPSTKETFKLIHKDRKEPRDRRDDASCIGKNIA